MTLASILSLLGGALVYYTHTRPVRDEASASAPATTVEFVRPTLQALEIETAATVPVVLDGAASADVTVDYRVLGGTATNGEDYTLPSTGTLRIPRGERGVSLPLGLADDKKEEGNETIQLELVSPQGVELGANRILEFTIADPETLESDEYFGLGDEPAALPDFGVPEVTELPDFSVQDPTELPDFAREDPTSLTVTDGLRLHLDADTLAEADGASVQTWTDASGLNNNASQANSSERPLVIHDAMNGKKAVRFDGSDDSLVITDNTSLQFGASDFSTFIVSSVNNVSKGTSSQNTFLSKPNAGFEFINYQGSVRGYYDASSFNGVGNFRSGVPSVLNFNISAQQVVTTLNGRQSNPETSNRKRFGCGYGPLYWSQTWSGIFISFGWRHCGGTCLRSEFGCHRA